MRDQRKIRHLEFETLAKINEEVVVLTGERHSYTKDDEQNIRGLLAEVKNAANEGERSECVIQKVSLLVFRIASGQHFHEGNKRSALVAGQTFLKANGYMMNIQNKDLVRVVDEAGVGKADLSKLNTVIRALIKND